jgi:predicted Rossmann fold flavoprotein
VKEVKVSIKNTKHFYNGPILITHWGLSGPAVLKLSAFAAKHFYETDYNNTITINWLHDIKTHDAEQRLVDFKKSFPKQLVINANIDLPKRLWHYLTSKANLLHDLTWSNISNSQIQKLAKLLTADEYHMQGKTTFKEEFVTAGGVNLKEIDFKTMESKLIPGMFFCGEVINIDGITGGFNFQAAWSTAYIAASSV